jgi:hypothetical protein
MGLDMYLTGQVYISKYDEKTRTLRNDLQELFKTDLTPKHAEFEIMY